MVGKVGAEHFLDLLAILHQGGAISEEDYRKTAGLFEGIVREDAPPGGPSRAVDLRIGRKRSWPFR